ncbi:MAG: hypothetical protein F7C35_02320 [Desulfurococcales archaeon]|nr:hypothetical protein [Desulfurococcales archaeon]
MRKQDPRVLLARALTLTRQAIKYLERAEWRLKSLGDEAGDLLYQVVYLHLLLSRIALRLETLIVVYSATGTVRRDLLGLPIELVRQASKAIRQSTPEVSSIILELDEALTSVYEAVPEPPPTLQRRGEPLREEAKQILAEIEEEAKKRVAQLTQ